MIPIAADSWQTKTHGPAGPMAVLGMLLAAILIQSIAIPVDADVSWLITVCERVLAGDRLYADIIEANPPASVWLYLPSVWLAQLIGLRPEPVVIGFAMTAALLSIQTTVALVSKMQRPPSPFWLAAGAAFVTLILPGGLFAQREHFALMLALPVIAVTALMAERLTLSATARIAAGAAAGLVMVIKPHFLLAMLFPALWSLARARDVRPFVLPAAAALALLSAYAVATLLIASAYLDLLPMLEATYLPMRDRPLNFLLGPMLTVPLVLFLLGRLLRLRRTSPLATALFLGSAGFALAGLVQGKNYLNHSYPGVALAMLALWLLLGERAASPVTRKLVSGAAALLLAMQLYSTASVQPPAGLVEAIQASAPNSPTIMTLGTELATGHPAARLAGARWVGSRPSLFTAAGARYAGLNDPDARHWHDEDLGSFVRDVERERPDLLLVEDRSRGWLLADPAISAAVSGYAPVARAGDIEVWRRR